MLKNLTHYIKKAHSLTVISISVITVVSKLLVRGKLHEQRGSVYKGS